MKPIFFRIREWLDGYGKVAVLVFGFVLFGVGVYTVSYTTKQTLTVSFLDIGQGDAILIETPSRKRVLIDGGPNNTVIRRLNEELPFFVRSLDIVLATHTDADHITGLVPVLDLFSVKTVFVSATGTTEIFSLFNERVLREGGNSMSAVSGQVIDFADGVYLYVLYPSNKHKRISKESNDVSTVTLVTYGEHSFLLTGDLPSKQENILLQSTRLGKHVTVFKAGHHGSNTSSGEALLSYIQPEYSVVSAGKDNRYGHPHKEAMERLKKYSKEVISTTEKGTISFISDGRTLRVSIKK